MCNKLRLYQELLQRSLTLTLTLSLSLSLAMYQEPRLRRSTLIP